MKVLRDFVVYFAVGVAIGLIAGEGVMGLFECSSDTVPAASQLYVELPQV